MKQQATINKVFNHLKYVSIRYTRFISSMVLMLSFSESQECKTCRSLARVVRMSFDFYMQFDVATQDPEQMLERVRAIAELAPALDKSGTLDTERLYRLAVGQIMPGASEKIIIPKETASQKAVDEERQTIAELVAGVPPNVRPQDAHEMKMQVFQQWLHSLIFNRRHNKIRHCRSVYRTTCNSVRCRSLRSKMLRSADLVRHQRNSGKPPLRRRRKGNTLCQW